MVASGWCTDVLLLGCFLVEHRSVHGVDGTVTVQSVATPRFSPLATALSGETVAGRRAGCQRSGPSS